MRGYWKLARPHHWVKNVLVLLPLMCSGQLLLWEKLSRGLWAFLAFSLLASTIYCINDVRDRDKDRQNPEKAGRPVAAGVLSPKQALGFGGVLFLLAAVCGFFAAGRDGISWLWLGCYFVLNLGYSLGLKNYPLVDIAILAAGFLLRLLYGGAVTDIELSKWLCLTVIAMSFYLGLGKRRGERLGGQAQSRAVLKYYSEGFLDKNMYLCVALGVMFYALWTVDDLTVRRVGGEALVWTVPLVILICMRYSLDLETHAHGDPVEVLLHDKLLLLLALLLGLAIFAVMYLW
jgi:4-hydroxybenzoate polyprenyltransferase